MRKIGIVEGTAQLAGENRWIAWSDIEQCVRKWAGRYRVPADVADLAAISVLQRIEADEGSEGIEEEVKRELARLSKVQARSQRSIADAAACASRPAGLSIPPLCPRIARFAPFCGSRKEFLGRLHRAAMRVSHEPAILGNWDRASTFLLAYADLRPLSEIRRLTRAPTERAVKERLRRASRRIESTIVRRITRPLDPHTKSVMEAAVQGEEGLFEHESRLLVRIADDFSRKLARIASE